MLLGTYERAGVPWSEQNTPWDFTHELLPPDLDRIAPSLEVAFQHYPAIERAGIRKVINGPFTFAPDGNPVIGPVCGRPNYWVACGVMAGFCQGGGVGLALSNWMVHGDPGFDSWAIDVARFGDWTTRGYTNAKVRENYSRRFRIRFPNEELPAARPLRTSPVYDRLKQCGAVFGESFGLEHALWFAPAGSEASEEITFRRSNAHGPVGEECRAVRNAVGLTETSSYSKYVVTGAGAEAWLSKLLSNRMPVTGRIVLAPMLNPNGKLIGDWWRSSPTSDFTCLDRASPRATTCAGSRHSGPTPKSRSVRCAPSSLAFRSPARARASYCGDWWRPTCRTRRSRSSRSARWIWARSQPWLGVSHSLAILATRSGYQQTTSAPFTIS